MSDTIDNLILEHLKRIQAEQAAARDRDRDMMARLSTLESGMGSLIQHIGHLASSIASQQVSLDRMSDRVDRIERRLELV